MPRTVSHLAPSCTTDEPDRGQSGVFYGYRGILVHVWETCRSTDGHRLMRCNCSTRFSGVPEGHHSAGRCGIDIGRVNQLSGKTQAIPPMSYIPSPTTYAYPMYPPAQLYQQVSPYAVQAPQPQVYSTSTTGIPVNVHGGVVLTEARGIFIRNLSYNVTSNDLNQLLYTVGIPLKSQLLTDHKGAFKGSATALFKSKDEALYAIARLNGKEHMGMTIQVRMDTETTVVGRAEPMVVNGSYAVSGLQYHRDIISDI
ncbi:hypothetical protein J1614_007497 [Plenodomus biglobosus]|nr:hypothetical protein J1614_007497 [Plenodomus biglobosus]